MDTSKIVTFPEISLKLSKEINEKYIQEYIAKDPSVLGLGELILKDKERMQPNAGRLDLLCQDSDPDSNRRYEIELQLGKADESHIIRTIEYWDIERKRYPQYDHCAVIIENRKMGYRPLFILPFFRFIIWRGNVKIFSVWFN